MFLSLWRFSVYPQNPPITTQTVPWLSAGLSRSAWSAQTHMRAAGSPPSLPLGFQLTVPSVAMGKHHRVESLEGAPQKLLPFLLSFLFRAERVEAERPRQEKPISQQNTPSQPLGTASQGLQLLAPKALPALPFALSVPHGGALRNSSGASSSTAPHTGSF